MGSDADMEDYGFEYSDDEPEEQDVDIENQYYNSKGLVETDPEGALAGFAEVVRMEPEKAEWGFKALKQTVKLYYRLGKYKEMMDSYRVMLTYIKSAVTRNYSEKCINNIMDFVSGSASQSFGLLQEFYQTTLKALEEAKNERLWFKTNLKLCKIWFDIGEYGRMIKILKELHKSCQREDGTDDQKKGSQLLEVYAIEIQMYTETKNNKKLKQLYQKALAIKSAIPHPRIMGIIRECGGKMHMAERQWPEAATDFFEAFKNYDEAGNQRRIQCLKYLVLANMLMESEVNPFDGQEAKPYKNDPEILAMTNLIAAYQRNEILEFEKILKSNRRTIMDDPFIRNYIEDLLKNVRTQVLLKLIKPYTRIRIPFISKELNVPEKDVEQLLVSLILDNRIDGHIDQVNRLLERGDRSKGMKKYTAIDKWNTQLKSLFQTVSNRDKKGFVCKSRCNDNKDGGSAIELEMFLRGKQLDLILNLAFQQSQGSLISLLKRLHNFSSSSSLRVCTSNFYVVFPICSTFEPAQAVGSERLRSAANLGFELKTTGITVLSFVSFQSASHSHSTHLCLGIDAGTLEIGNRALCRTQELWLKDTEAASNYHQ
ncbi:unnamed protein product [Citrullus colocynthis]|uniref:COP9 signalosome complex subunit 2 n=1 Tax=Citrullus colocynthis TaxID=252529 RepID=A0ABP0Y0Z9_9ROSI